MNHNCVESGSKFLIVGLGNPGKKYTATRHNVGFMVVESLASKFKAKFKKYQNIFWSTSIEYNRKKLLIVKPATFMNLSGNAVVCAMHYFDVVLSNILVICDDINLKFGTIRIRSKGSDGGQKGVRSVISQLSTQNFSRLRIGIKDHVIEAAEYVLSPFNTAEQKELPFIIETAADAVLSFVLNGIELTMSRFNRNYLGN